MLILVRKKKNCVYNELFHNLNPICFKCHLSYFKTLYLKILYSVGPQKVFSKMCSWYLGVIFYQIENNSEWRAGLKSNLFEKPSILTQIGFFIPNQCVNTIKMYLSQSTIARASKNIIISIQNPKERKKEKIQILK